MKRSSPLISDLPGGTVVVLLPVCQQLRLAGDNSSLQLWPGSKVRSAFYPKMGPAANQSRNWPNGIVSLTLRRCSLQDLDVLSRSILRIDGYKAHPLNDGHTRADTTKDGVCRKGDEGNEGLGGMSERASLRQVTALKERLKRLTLPIEMGCRR